MFCLTDWLPGDFHPISARQSQAVLPPGLMKWLEYPLPVPQNIDLKFTDMSVFTLFQTFGCTIQYKYLFREICLQWDKNNLQTHLHTGLHTRTCMLTLNNYNNSNIMCIVKIGGVLFIVSWWKLFQWIEKAFSLNQSRVGIKKIYL